MMTTGDALRERILAHGIGLASARGLHALSISDMARDLEMSRSGLFAHFATQEMLQLGVLEQAAQVFIRDVIEPATAAPDGAVRVNALFARWIAWSRSPTLRGGCPFVHASAESHGLPGPVRQRLTEVLGQWSEILKQAVEAAKSRHEFRADLDADQLVFELHGLYLSHHFWHWSMRDPHAEVRTRKAMDRLIADAKRS